MTYSIVARDPDTGFLGVAVQTYWFGVGSIVPWVEPNVGAVATQSFVEPSYGPQGLDLLRAGRPAAEALEQLTAADGSPELRQVAIIDATGAVAAHTGEGCCEAAGHVLGRGVSCQANMMEKATVWDAMLGAFTEATGDLADRMMAALRAAEDEGGDIRGRQSAALVVAPAGDAKPWDRTVDLRVDDHQTPLDELERLLHVSRAWEAVGVAGDHAEDGDVDAARSSFEEALALSPRDPQIAFWAGTFFATDGDDPARAKELMAAAVRIEPRYPTFLRRLADKGRFPADEALMDDLLPE